MEKKCFVIMPISDHKDYPQGHFNRVYEYIIQPACIKAGFKPLRADEVQTTNYIAIDILKHIVEAEMAICDLSSKNPNVLYELGIRQAFDLPVTFIKDTRTSRIFDIQGFRDVEYDEKLRVDLVDETINTISETISNTHENKDSETNSLIKYLGIEPAKINPSKITGDTQILLNALSNISSRLSDLEEKEKPTIDIPYDFKKDIVLSVTSPKSKTQIKKILEELKEGDEVFHKRFQKGVVKKIITPQNIELSKVIIYFDEVGEKTLVLKYADLTKI